MRVMTTGTARFFYSAMHRLGLLQRLGYVVDLPGAVYISPVVAAQAQGLRILHQELLLVRCVRRVAVDTRAFIRDGAMHQGRLVYLFLHIVVAVQAQVLRRQVQQLLFVRAVLVVAVQAVVLEGRVHIVHLQFFGLGFVALGTQRRYVSYQQPVGFRLVGIMAFHTLALGYRLMLEFLLGRFQGVALGAELARGVLLQQVRFRRAVRCVAFQAVALLHRRVHHAHRVVLVVAFVAQLRHRIGQRKGLDALLRMGLAIAGMAFVAAAFQRVMHHVLGYQVAMASRTRTTALAGINLPAGAAVNTSQYYQ